jgi:hypothetical protein
MADQDKQTGERNRNISPDDRFHYIGFDVFPGKPEDLFRSEAEKAQYVDTVVKRRSQGERLREQCSLVIARVSSLERLVLAAACVIILLMMVPGVPWYSGYDEITIQPAQTSAGSSVTASAKGAQGEEVITSMQVQKKTRKEPFSMSALGSLFSIGSVGGKMFSSGFVLILTAIIALAFTLLSIGLPIYVLMTLFKPKGTGDEAALHLKKLLRLNWLPIILFASALVLSFFGADYASGIVPTAAGVTSSFGTSYGPGAFLGTLSWGMILTLGGFLILAAKGIEI